MAEHSGRQHNRASRWSSPKVRDDMVRRYVEDRQSLRQIAAAPGAATARRTWCSPQPE
ncbi:hypothetical protein OHA72_22090 [Dactylosporangium sp. NBC_01737]|uniref:hypothetical protein n=1 Tax=Dactylosporangium sp. NBC_01737 TaxID=2975959 RepID=UPI002E0FA8BC|nr:hypothetical protein OHA72_22090 [Dactylosporangium sp. NBC_01737]